MPGPPRPARRRGRDGGATSGGPDRPDRDRLPPRREPQHADARRWPPALREARRCRSRLRPRDVRADARRRADGAALPEAPAPLDAHGGPAGVGARRAVRHRAPRPAQRAAQAGPGARAARALLALAQHPPGVGATAVGGTRDRGAPRRARGDVHQDPPRPRRRRLGDAPARERAVDRPRRAQHARPLGDASTRAARGAREHGRCVTVRRHERHGAYGARDRVGGRRHARRAGPHPQQERAQRDVRAVALRPAHHAQPEHHRLAALRRPGLAGRAAAGGRSRERHHHQRRGARHGQRRDADLPARARRAARHVADLDGAGRPQRQAVPARLGRRRQRGRLGDGAARHPPARPGRPARGDPPLDGGRQGQRCRR